MDVCADLNEICELNDAESPGVNVYELLYRKLLEPMTGTAAVAAILEGVLSRLFAELTGPNKESAFEAVSRCEGVFQQTVRALQDALDVQSTNNCRLQHFHKQLEDQLKQAMTLCKGANTNSFSYLDRVNTTHQLQQLLATCRAVLAVELPYQQLSEAA